MTRSSSLPVISTPYRMDIIQGTGTWDWKKRHHLPLGYAASCWEDFHFLQHYTPLQPYGRLWILEGMELFEQTGIAVEIPLRMQQNCYSNE